MANRLARCSVSARLIVVGARAAPVPALEQEPM